MSFRSLSETNLVDSIGSVVFDCKLELRWHIKNCLPGSLISLSSILVIVLNYDVDVTHQLLNVSVFGTVSLLHCKFFRRGQWVRLV